MKKGGKQQKKRRTPTPGKLGTPVFHVIFGGQNLKRVRQEKRRKKSPKLGNELGEGVFFSEYNRN